MDMKKTTLYAMILLILLFPLTVFCENTSDWTVSPIITKAYELESEKLYLEWQGNAPVYQIYMDGSNLASVIVNSAVIPLKKGSHNIIIYPISEAKSAETNLPGRGRRRREGDPNPCRHARDRRRAYNPFGHPTPMLRKPRLWSFARHSDHR